MLSSAYKFLPAQLAERLRNITLTVRRPVEGNLQGAHPSPHHGSSVEFAEYREYTPGDPPNLIDWAVYARSDRTMIRRFQEETNLRATLLVDTSESLLFKGNGPLSKMEYASFLAAGLMYILVNQGDSVGLITFDQGLNRMFAPTGTLEGLRPLLLHLESIKPTGLSNIEASLHQAAEKIRSRSLIIMISDLLQKPADILRGLRHLHHERHDLIILHILDEGECRLPFRGLTELRELETGKKMIVETDELRDSYQRMVNQYIDELRQGCTNCQANYHLVFTSIPVEELLFMRITRR